MATRTHTETRTDHAARVARKILGDLQAIHRHYKCRDKDYMHKLAHDIEKGLEHNCLDDFEFCLYEQSTDKLLEVYKYFVNEDGDVDYVIG